MKLKSSQQNCGFAFQMDKSTDISWICSFAHIHPTSEPTNHLRISIIGELGGKISSAKIFSVP